MKELWNCKTQVKCLNKSEVTASQPVFSAMGELFKDPVPNIPGEITKKSKSDKKQSNDTDQEQHSRASVLPVNILSVVDDGFIGVERKQNSTKQLFLTGISENVKEYQIQSYLVDRDVTPTWITLF